jgi:hypothetical protein
MIVKPKITNEEFFNENGTSIKKSNMITIKFGPFTKPIFKLEMCVVKYALGRFDKITLEHQHDEFSHNLNNSIKTALGEEASKFSEIKIDEIGIKIPESLKASVEKLQKFDVIDVLIEFNNCWVMSGKIYASFVLKDFKESAEKPASYDTPFLFKDIE